MPAHLALDQPSHRKPPSPFSLLLESRVMLDLATLPLSFASGVFAEKAPSNALPIITFPGFGSDERYLSALKKYLSKLGYQVEGWGLGTNLAGANFEHTLDDLHPRWEFELPDGASPESYKGEGGVAFLCDKAIERVKQRSQELASPVVLIGWSLGGYIARECARELPEDVAQVITFGAPVYGGPKYSRAASVFRARGLDLDWIEESVDQRYKNPIKQPITAIYSKLDGIVDWSAAVDTSSPNVDNVEVRASHLGMGFNHRVWRIVANALAEFCETQMPAC